MTPIRSSLRPPRRFALLLAALLHLLGAVAGPVLHANLGERPAADMVALDRERDDTPAPPHDERHCVVCQGLGTWAVPSAESVLPGADVVRAAERPHTSLAPAARPVRAAPARAPPSIS